MKRNLPKQFKQFLQSRGFYRAPLRTVLILPFVLQAVLIVTIVSHLSYQHGLSAAGRAQAEQVLTRAKEQVQTTFQVDLADLSSAIDINSEAQTQQVDLRRRINSVLQTLSLDTATQVWILNRSGQVLGHTSSQELHLSSKPSLHKGIQPYIISGYQGTPIRIISEERLIRTLTEQIGDLADLQEMAQLQIRTGSDLQLLQIQPLESQPELNLLLLLATPEQVWGTTQLFHTWQTFSFSLVAIVVAIAIGLLTTQWITRPIKNLIQATQLLAQGDFTHLPTMHHRTDELGELEKTFKVMAEQLQQSFTELQTLNDALAESGNRLLQFLDVLPIGVAVHAVDGQVFYTVPVHKL